MEQKDLYIRLSDPSGNKPDTISHHRVWDSERFIAAQQEQHTGPNVKPGDKRIISLATREEFKEYLRK